MLPLSSVLGLRYDLTLRHWQDATIPRLSRYLRHAGPSGGSAGSAWQPDLLLVDTALFGFIFDWLRPSRSIYRIADYNPAFASATPQLSRIEREASRKADIVVYTAPALADYVSSLSPKRLTCVPNGVDLAHYSRSTVPPDEYLRIPEPRAVYVGALREWFDYDLVNRLAANLPEVSFVIIGPDAGTRDRFADLANLHVIGQRPYDRLPAYLAGATLGLIPFDRATHPALVNHVNPLKLYEYMAAGLPVVATRWPVLTDLASPVILCDGLDAFAAGIHQAIAERDRLSSESIAFASGCDWSARTNELLGAVGF